MKTMAIFFLLIAVVIIRGENTSKNQFTQALSIDSNQQLPESAVRPPATYLEVPALDDYRTSVAHNEKPAEVYGLPPLGYYLPKPIVKEAPVQPALYLTPEQSSQPPITAELSIQPLAIKAPVQPMLPLLPLPPMPMMGD